MELTLLGTGNAMVTNCYNTCFVLEDQGQYLLVDGGGGNGLLRQLKDAGIPWQKLRDVFVTHSHVDHIMGIVWMLRLYCQNMSRGKYDGQVRIYGHRQVVALLRQLAEGLLSKKECSYLDTAVHLIPVEDGEQRTICGWPITFFDLGSTKLKQFGFTLELPEGGKLTCCGDEPCAPANEHYARNSKWLLHEAFCLHAQADVFKPYEKHHSTALDACQLAQRLGVQNLVLYHTEDSDIPHRKERYTQEGAPHFSGGLYVPNDLEHLQL